jgi:hypothetical protein
MSEYSTGNAAVPTIFLAADGTVAFVVTVDQEKGRVIRRADLGEVGILAARFGIEELQMAIPRSVLRPAAPAARSFPFSLTSLLRFRRRMAPHAPVGLPN